MVFWIFSITLLSFSSFFLLSISSAISFRSSNKSLRYPLNCLSVIPMVSIVPPFFTVSTAYRLAYLLVK
nr:MAG TPA: hypothetical protein [Caudoviricetes sp.]